MAATDKDRLLIEPPGSAMSSKSGAAGRAAQQIHQQTAFSIKKIVERKLWLSSLLFTEKVIHTNCSPSTKRLRRLSMLSVNTEQSTTSFKALLEPLAPQREEEHDVLYLKPEDAFSPQGHRKRVIRSVCWLLTEQRRSSRTVGSVDGCGGVFTHNVPWYADSREFWQKWREFELEQPTVAEEVRCASTLSKPKAAPEGGLSAFLGENVVAPATDDRDDITQ
ncbi:hypothetical protein V8F20_008978 [Naviculisporaceae sp. PSN 640]